MSSPIPRCVCIETPLRGDYERNVRYADACMLDSLDRGEAPFLGHLLYPRVLNDADPVQRAQGIEGHCAWLRRADAVIIYSDLGVTDGMRLALELAQQLDIPFEYRTLPGFGSGQWLTRMAAVAAGSGHTRAFFTSR